MISRNNEVRFNYGLLLLHAGDLPNGFAGVRASLELRRLP